MNFRYTFMASRATAQQKNSFPRGYGIYIFGRSFLGGHYYYLYIQFVLCSGVETFFLSRNTRNFTLYTPNQETHVRNGKFSKWEGCILRPHLPLAVAIFLRPGRSGFFLLIEYEDITPHLCNSPQSQLLQCLHAYFRVNSL